MHIFWLFFAWPNGGAWSNVAAMPVCGVIAGVFAVTFRDRLGRAVSGWWRRHFGHHAELDDIKATLKAHADLLDVHTPGGLNAVLDEVRRAVTAAESAHEDIKALGMIKPPPRRGTTEMRKTAGSRPAPRDDGGV